MLANAKFTLYKKVTGGSDAKIGDYVTDVNGLITIGELTEGDYYFIEVAAPKGMSSTQPNVMNSRYPIRK